VHGSATHEFFDVRELFILDSEIMQLGAIPKVDEVFVVNENGWRIRRVGAVFKIRFLAVQDQSGFSRIEKDRRKSIVRAVDDEGAFRRAVQSFRERPRREKRIENNQRQSRGMA